jgi:phage antirepressor YoqD-like protein
MSALIIAGTSIRRDDAGRYFLNDLHRASGGGSNHAPAQWLRNKQTQELIAVIARDMLAGSEGAYAKSHTPIFTCNDGITNGTFVAKELVYAYAMWINAEFHLKVIRAYDQLVAVPAGPVIPQSFAEALRLAADKAEEAERANAALAIAAPKAEALDLISASDESVTLTEAAKLLGVKREKLTSWMHANGWVYRQNGRWLAHQVHINNGRLQYKESKYTDQRTGYECFSPYCHILPKGLTKLATAFAQKEAA